MTEQCEGCKDAHRRIDSIEGRISVVEERSGQMNQRFGEHMKKEEAAFESFYAQLRKIEERLASIVMSAMEQRADIRDEFNDNLSKLRDEITNKHPTWREVKAFALAITLAFSVITGGLQLYSSWRSATDYSKATNEAMQQIVDRLERSGK